MKSQMVRSRFLFLTTGFVFAAALPRSSEARVASWDDVGDDAANASSASAATSTWTGSPGLEPVTFAHNERAPTGLFPKGPRG